MTTGPPPRIKNTSAPHAGGSFILDPKLFNLLLSLDANTSYVQGTISVTFGQENSRGVEVILPETLVDGSSESPANSAFHEMTNANRQGTSSSLVN